MISKKDSLITQAKYYTADDNQICLTKESVMDRKLRHYIKLGRHKTSIKLTPEQK